ncbi:TonB-dependent receptor plug domain-containing protein [Parachitinimonas caeni]|uniref:TonB-dependent receptor n=1 Tax=Parachitinimonas caeni TaxID=3031301 RepID=A0ABT7E2E8_9NEIS|nr:TonB-dependent receptor [Parachitinimonas caeni]MDK2125590.1 TonB-dependent receptor [Parachitinimonas caeni]
MPLATALSCFLQLAWAETDKPSTEPAPAKVEAITINGAQASDSETRQQSTAARQVFSREEIRRYGDSTLGEVLKRLPGVTLGGGRKGTISLRGMGGGYTQILLNGEPVPSGFSLESLSPDLVERVELLRAPVAEYSAQAIAGTLNIVLREQPRKRSNELSANLAFADSRAGATTSLQKSDRNGDLSYTLLATAMAGEEPQSAETVSAHFDGNGMQILRNSESDSGLTRHASLNLAPRFAWKPAAGTSYSLQPYLSLGRHQSRTDSLLDHLGQGPAPYRKAHDVSEDQHQSARLNGSLARKHDTGKLEVKVSLDFSHQRNRSDRSEYADSGLQSRRISDDGHTRTRRLASSGKYAHPLADTQTLALGWDGDWVRQTRQRSTLENGQPQTAGDNVEQTVNIPRLALFGQGEWQVGSAWSVYAGLRWEMIETRSEALRSLRNRSSVFSPGLQLLWRVPGSEKDQFRASLARSYKAPRLSDLLEQPSRSDLNTPLNADSVGNPQLKPELAWGLELGYEHYRPEGGVLSANLFAREIDDVIRRQTDWVDGRWVSTPRNFSKAHVRGIELEAKFKLAEWWAAAPPLEVKANYSRYWSRVDGIPGPDNRLSDQATASANLGLDYRFTGLPLTAGIQYNWAPEFRVRTSESQWRQVGSNRSVSSHLQWRFGNDARFKLSYTPALDDFVNRRDSQLAQGGYLSERYQSQAETRWSASFEMKY